MQKKKKTKKEWKGQTVCHHQFKTHLNQTPSSCRTNYTCVKKSPWNVLMCTPAFSCLSGLFLDTQPWTSSHPHCFFISVSRNASYSVSRLVQKRGGGGSSGGGRDWSYQRSPPAHTIYAMWWYKSYLIMWELAAFQRGRKGARCYLQKREFPAWPSAPEGFIRHRRPNLPLHRPY